MVISFSKILTKELHAQAYLSRVVSHEIKFDSIDTTLVQGRSFQTPLLGGVFHSCKQSPSPSGFPPGIPQFEATQVRPVSNVMKHFLL